MVILTTMFYWVVAAISLAATVTKGWGWPGGQPCLFSPHRNCLNIREQRGERERYGYAP